MEMTRINKLIKIMLDLASKAEEHKETPFDIEMGLGYRAFSGYVMSGVKDIIDFQSKYYSAVESERLVKSELKDNEETLESIFGSLYVPDYNDEEIAKIKAVVKEIEDSWEDEE